MSWLGDTVDSKPEGEGTPVGQSPDKDGAGLRPTLDEVKAGAKQTRSLGGAIPKRGPGRPPNAARPSAPAQVAPLPPPFVWSSKDVEIVGSAPFDGAYAVLGPEHEHWKAAGDRLKSSGVYEKFAHVLNRLGAQDPIYLILALAAVQYLGVLGSCGYQSWQKSQAENAEKEKAAK